MSLLEIQKYLKSGKTLDDLTAELAIRVARHDTDPLAILNYDQIDSPKLAPIVREARGLVLHSESSISSPGPSRASSTGRGPGRNGLFDFSDFFVHTKEDGSLVLLYHFNGRLAGEHARLFRQDKIQFHDYTWDKLFCQALASPHCGNWMVSRHWPHLRLRILFDYNKVVRRYPEPTLFLLTASRDSTNYPGAPRRLPFPRPQRHHFTSVEEHPAFLKTQAVADPTLKASSCATATAAAGRSRAPRTLACTVFAAKAITSTTPKIICLSSSPARTRSC